MSSDTKVRELACPNCKGTDLELTEKLIGGCRSTFRVAGNAKTGDRDVEPHGYTEVYWDSSESVGIYCKTCQWGWGDIDTPDYEGALKRLVLAP